MTRLGTLRRRAVFAAVAAIAVGAAGWAGLGAAPAAAEDGAFPTQPIKVIVPFKPGGRTDTVARLLAKAIEDNGFLDQPMAVVNVPGGAGANAVAALQREAADGHAIVHWHHQSLIAMAMQLGDFSLNDFRSIGYTGGGSPVWTVRSDSGFDDLSGLIDNLKAEPKGLVEAVGIGTIPHFVGAMLAMEAGFETRYVTANSGADRLRMILGGNADIALFAASEYLRSGEGLRPLVYFGNERLPELPDVPTSRELGFQVSWANPNWWLAPADTPDEAMASLSAALEKAIALPEIQEYFRNNTLEPYWTPGDAAMAEAEAVLSRLEPVAANIR